jgi:hypothetical protein
VTTAETIADINTVLPTFQSLHAALTSELATLEALGQQVRLNREQQAEEKRLRNTLYQVEKGVDPDDGADERVDALLRTPEALRLRTRARMLLGIAPLQRHRERLAVQAQQEADRAAIVWPRKYRFTAKFGKHQQDGRYLQPGDVVMLTESQATAWADRFELATDVAAN